MPTKPMTPCSFPMCPALVPAGTRFCIKHQKSETKRYNSNRPSARARGYDRQWEAVRQMKLNRDPVCEQCGKALATMVHHIESVKDRPNLRLEMKNLMSLCNPCHEAIHNRFRGKWA